MCHYVYCRNIFRRIYGKPAPISNTGSSFRALQKLHYQNKILKIKSLLYLHAFNIPSLTRDLNRRRAASKIGAIATSLITRRHANIRAGRHCDLRQWLSRTCRCVMAYSSRHSLQDSRAKRGAHENRACRWHPVSHGRDL